MDIKVDISNLGISDKDIKAESDAAEAALDAIWDVGDDVAAWVREPMRRDEYSMEELIMTAVAAQDSCSLFLVVGNGGSIQSIKAAVEALDERPPTAPDVEFIGDEVSTFKYDKLMEKMRHYEVNVCVISQSGMTPETIVSYQVVREAMIRRYGPEDAFKRILVMTGEQDSSLRRLAKKDGAGIFDMLTGFGGSYSILSKAGLFVLSVAGLDVKSFLRGAEVAASDPSWDLHARDYAVARKIMADRGKTMEVLQVSESSLDSFARWVSSMYAESAGKVENPIYTVPLSLAGDFKSMGQALIGSKKHAFETEIVVEEVITDMLLTDELGASGNSLPSTINQVNKIISNKIKQVYKREGIQPITISVPVLDSHHLGQLMYFFMMTAAISAFMMGENPFDRDAVIQVKEETLEEILSAAEKEKE